MQTFTIDSENNITFYASLKQTEGSAEGTETFSSPKELGKLAAQWPVARLVEIWNSRPEHRRSRIWNRPTSQHVVYGTAAKDAETPNVEDRPAVAKTGAEGIADFRCRSGFRGPYMRSTDSRCD